MGSAGSDNFEIKVSADGSIVRAYHAVAATGNGTFDNGAVINGAVTGTGVQASTSMRTGGPAAAGGGVRNRWRRRWWRTLV